MVLIFADQFLDAHNVPVKHCSGQPLFTMFGITFGYKYLKNYRVLTAVARWAKFFQLIVVDKSNSRRVNVRGKTRPL